MFAMLSWPWMEKLRRWEARVQALVGTTCTFLVLCTNTIMNVQYVCFTAQKKRYVNFCVPSLTKMVCLSLYKK